MAARLPLGPLLQGHYHLPLMPQYLYKVANSMTSKYVLYVKAKVAIQLELSYFT